MNIIIKKVRLVAAPVPPFVGTRLMVRIEEANRKFGIFSADLLPDSVSGKIDWGDGTVETLERINQKAHTYESPGVYTVSISDDYDNLVVTSAFTTSAFTEIYAKEIIGITSNAQKMTTIASSAFYGATNLPAFDLVESSVKSIRAKGFYGCTALRTTAGLPHGVNDMPLAVFQGCTGLREVVLPESLTLLSSAIFRGCTGLSGTVRLPYVSNLKGSGVTAPFGECTGGITEIHFAAANEESIRASTAYQGDPTLGTGTAVCVFDL